MGAVLAGNAGAIIEVWDSSVALADANSSSGGDKKNTGDNVKNGSYDDLPDNAKKSYDGYEETAWKGNFDGQTPGTKAGGNYQNSNGALPTTDSTGNSITYKEFDINNKMSGMSRDAERFLSGSDGSIYYTKDHYNTFIKIK